MSRAHLHLLALAEALRDGSVAKRKAAVAALDDADCHLVAQLVQTEALRHRPGRPDGSYGLTLHRHDAARLVRERKDEWLRQNGRRIVPKRKTDEFIREALEEVGLEPSDDNVEGVRLLFRNGRAWQPVRVRRIRPTPEARRRLAAEQSR